MKTTLAESGESDESDELVDGDDEALPTKSELEWIIIVRNDLCKLSCHNNNIHASILLSVVSNKCKVFFNFRVPIWSCET